MKNNFKRNNYTWTYEFGCHLCRHFSNSAGEWPVKEKKLGCTLHDWDLSFMLNEDGFLSWKEAFCIQISPTVEYKFHTEEFNRIRNELKEGYLYILNDETIDEKSM
ncbi:MAG: hypothetical protein PHV06_00810 [bacterium]|nr:hypothetical protein [bacterium]